MFLQHAAILTCRWDGEVLLCCHLAVCHSQAIYQADKIVPSESQGVWEWGSDFNPPCWSINGGKNCFATLQSGLNLHFTTPCRPLGGAETRVGRVKLVQGLQWGGPCAWPPVLHAGEGSVEESWGGSEKTLSWATGTDYDFLIPKWEALPSI